MAGRFDITRVRLRHYRSIAACDVELGPLTLLVGPNGSGKSSFLDALRLTAQGLSENQAAFSALVDVQLAQTVPSFAHLVRCVGRLLDRDPDRLGSPG